MAVVRKGLRVVEEEGWGWRGAERRMEVEKLFSCVIVSLPVSLIIPLEQRAKMWAQQENINGLCDITVPAHSEEMFFYNVGHQQVIFHCSLEFIEVYSCLIMCHP